MGFGFAPMLGQQAAQSPQVKQAIQKALQYGVDGLLIILGLIGLDGTDVLMGWSPASGVPGGGNVFLGDTLLSSTRGGGSTTGAGGGLSGGTGDPNDPRNWRNNDAIDQNKLAHIFGQAKHNLDGFLKSHGGNQVSAFNAIDRAAQAHVTNHGLTGVNQFTVNVGGHSITVKGNVVDGAFKIGTAFIP